MQFQVSFALKRPWDAVGALYEPSYMPIGCICNIAPCSDTLYRVSAWLRMNSMIMQSLRRPNVAFLIKSSM